MCFNKNYSKLEVKFKFNIFSFELLRVKVRARNIPTTIPIINNIMYYRRIIFDI